MATPAKVPTPAGWKVIATPEGWLTPEYKEQEANSSEYPLGSGERYYPIKVKGLEYYWWALRRSNADPTIWYLLVGYSTDLVNFSNSYVFTQKSLPVPPDPNFAEIAPLTGKKAILIGVALGGAAIIAAFLGRRFMSRKKGGRR